MIHTKHCKYHVKCPILIDFSRVLRRRITLFHDVSRLFTVSWLNHPISAPRWSLLQISESLDWSKWMCRKHQETMVFSRQFLDGSRVILRRYLEIFPETNSKSLVSICQNPNFGSLIWVNLPMVSPVGEAQLTTPGWRRRRQCCRCPLRQPVGRASWRCGFRAANFRKPQGFIVQKDVGMGQKLLPSGNLLHSYWKWWCIVDLPSYKIVIFHRHVSLPEGNLTIFGGISIHKPAMLGNCIVVITIMNVNGHYKPTYIILYPWVS